MNAWNAIQLVKCASCRAIIEGQLSRMIGHRQCRDERAWYANGNNGRYFALCPDHASIENIRSQFAKVGVGRDNR